MKKPIAEQVRRRIQKQGEGSLFLVRDFLDLGSQETITRTLSRLVQEGLLRRLRNGLYHYPRISKLLEKPVPPAPEEVAAALARRTGARIVPSQAQTANALGLTTQVPAKNVFRTNGGKARRVKVGNQTIELRPVAPSQFYADEAGPIIQALRFVGEGNVTEDMIARLKEELRESQKAALRREWRNAPFWMHSILREIAR